MLEITENCTSAKVRGKAFSSTPTSRANDSPKVTDPLNGKPQK